MADFSCHFLLSLSSWKLRKQSYFDVKQYLHFIQTLTETFIDSTMVQKSGGGIVTKKLHEEGVQEIGQYDNDQEIGSINKQNTFVGHPNLSELRRNLAIFLLPPKRKLNLLRKISQCPSLQASGPMRCGNTSKSSLNLKQEKARFVWIRIFLRELRMSLLLSLHFPYICNMQFAIYNMHVRC